MSVSTLFILTIRDLHGCVCTRCHTEADTSIRITKRFSRHTQQGVLESTRINRTTNKIRSSQYEVRFVNWLCSKPVFCVWIYFVCFRKLTRLDYVLILMAHECLSKGRTNFLIFWMFIYNKRLCGYFPFFCKNELLGEHSTFEKEEI